MPKEKQLSKILKVLQDHEKRIAMLEGKNVGTKGCKTKSWYKPGSTIGKVLLLLQNGFLNKPRSITNMISEFKTKDYHLKTSDLTLPLRTIVRRGLLKRTKINADGSPSKQWLYLKGSNGRESYNSKKM